MKRLGKEEKIEELRKAQLLEEIELIRQRIDALYENLSYIVEPELIDSCIYELNAFQCRYTFLLKLVKEEEKVKIS